MNNSLKTRFSLYPIGRLSVGAPRGMEDEDFDTTQLPIEIVPDVHIEDVSLRIRKGDFDIHKPGLGEYRIEELERIKFAVINRYPQHGWDADTGEYRVDADQAQRSRTLVHEIAACLRIIRPVTVRAGFCEGNIAENSQLLTTSLSTSQIQTSACRSISASSRSAIEILNWFAFFAPLFRTAMAGLFWKFRMSCADVPNHGVLSIRPLETRFFLWSSAIRSSVYLTESEQRTQREPSSEGKDKRIAWCEHFRFIRQGELLSLNSDPNLTVAPTYSMKFTACAITLPTETRFLITTFKRQGAMTSTVLSFALTC